MNNLVRMFAITAISIALLGMITPAAALQDWTTVAAACAGTDNNFFSGTPSADFPVARFITPGGRLTFNAFHTGFIAVHCNVDNPQDQGTNPAWNQLEVTYLDPKRHRDSNSVFVQLVRQDKSTGISTVVAEFDSSSECDLGPVSFCHNGLVRTFVKRFTHTFDFANNAYVVFGRLYRGGVSISPILIQMRLNAR